ncbi:hypothetical protein [Deinococcus alpinitundrae]|uniref:hypothetical protein n=1 Tax=Deinococcus alpinitundrae TaxID=468913 RepID=UPI0013796CDC|nr:hypothetical protein [Deinococcus alpinitundrae]
MTLLKTLLERKRVAAVTHVWVAQGFAQGHDAFSFRPEIQRDWLIWNLGGVRTVGEAVGIMAEEIRRVERMMARAEAYFLGGVCRSGEAWDAAAQAQQLDFECSVLGSDCAVFTQMRNELRALKMGG